MVLPLLFHEGEIALNNLLIRQRLNPFTCSKINLTLQYSIHNMPSLSHTLFQPSHCLLYKASYNAYCLSKKPQRSPSFHQRNRRALLSLSLTAISQACHTLSPQAQLIQAIATQILGGGSCIRSFQRPKSGKRHLRLYHKSHILIFMCSNIFQPSDPESCEPFSMKKP